MTESESNDSAHRINIGDIPESNDPLRASCTADGCTWGGTSPDPTRHVSEWNAHVKRLEQRYNENVVTQHRPEFVES